MVAGLNIKLRHWHMDSNPDDAVGGAVITGSVGSIYNSRLQENPESQLLLQQGLETIKTFTAIISPMAKEIEERDEVDVYAPYDHPYYEKRFRIRSVRHSDLNFRDPRSYTLLMLSRSIKAHGSQ